ncbi:DUF6867 family protein [Haliangium sp.]|uniref:DUF6867 family protein n=1 Tax=Haliangium sp. TaxID=2663208 RepID=UPI003D130EA4
MIGLLDATLAGFLVLTLALGGAAAYMTGQALASHWRPWWQVLLYSLLLGGADRFLGYALAGARLDSTTGYLIDSALFMVIGLVSFRLTRARQMVTQYPWLYERTSPLSWRDKG